MAQSAMDNTTDSHEIQFASVKDAVRWSEEVAMIQDVGSMFDGWLKVSSGRMTRQETIDIALTVSAITTACKPFKGLAAKAVWAGKDRGRDKILGLALASKMCITPEGCQKTTEQLITLGIGMIRRHRARELYGDVYSLGQIARDMGISRQQFSTAKAWSALRSQSTEQIAAWLEQATNEIGAELAVRGWLK